MCTNYNYDLLIHQLEQLDRMIIRRNRSLLVVGFVALLFLIWERSPGVVIKLSMIGEISDVTVAHMIVLGPLVLYGLLIWTLLHNYRVRKLIDLLNQQIEHLDSSYQRIIRLFLSEFADYSEFKYKDIYWWINVPFKFFFFLIIPLLSTFQILNSYSTFHPQFIRHKNDGIIMAVAWEKSKDGKQILGRNNEWDKNKYGKSPYDWSHLERISYLYFSDINSKGARGLLRRSEIEKNYTIVQTFPYVSPVTSWFHLMVSLLNITLVFHLMKIQLQVRDAKSGIEDFSIQNKQQTNLETESTTLTKTISNKLTP